MVWLNSKKGEKDTPINVWTYGVDLEKAKQPRDDNGRFASTGGGGGAPAGGGAAGGGAGSEPLDSDTMKACGKQGLEIEAVKKTVPKGAAYTTEGTNALEAARQQCRKATAAKDKATAKAHMVKARERLQKAHDSFEDENYHTIAKSIRPLIASTDNIIAGFGF